VTDSSRANARRRLTAKAVVRGQHGTSRSPPSPGVSSPDPSQVGRVILATRRKTLVLCPPRHHRLDPTHQPSTTSPPPLSRMQ
jgi:hypothetical protein